MVMNTGVMAYVQELLLTLPFVYAVAVVFLAACAIGGACVMIGVAVRAAPEAMRDLRAWRAIRKALIN
ncbi:MAG: hypothetical protein ACXWCY_19570 [Burkholderiales bacterium]